jgi:type IV pilus assembly protein PilX
MNGIPTRSAGPGRQKGAALIAAMVILLIMTIIGVTAISTTALEQKMAVNMQETNRALQAAESGLSKAINLAGAFQLYSSEDNPLEETYEFGADTGDGAATATTDVDTWFKAWAKPRRGSGYSAVQFSTANFEAASAATTDTGASTVLHQGLYQITPKLQ